MNKRMDRIQNKIIAVDFDGTLCENAWPDIGAPRKSVIDYVKEQQKQGAKLILWTNRSGIDLDNAVSWCYEYGLQFDVVNGNLPEMIRYYNNDCRKVFADEYIDDRAVPVPIPEEKNSLLTERIHAIKNRLILPELLTQLAEESAELAKAALKYRRALIGCNPTSLDKDAAKENLVEEMADVELCIATLSTPEEEHQKREIKMFKATRWLVRLRKAGK